MLTVLELVARELSGRASLPASTNRKEISAREDARPPNITTQFLTQLSEIPRDPEVPHRAPQLAKLMALEESVYRGGRKNNYFADYAALTCSRTTTERSPTYCNPAVPQIR